MRPIIAPVMTFPNPLNRDRYVVINSGFTFRQAALPPIHFKHQSYRIGRSSISALHRLRNGPVLLQAQAFLTISGKSSRTKPEQGRLLVRTPNPYRHRGHWSHLLQSNNLPRHPRPMNAERQNGGPPEQSRISQYQLMNGTEWPQPRCGWGGLLDDVPGWLG